VGFISLYFSFFADILLDPEYPHLPDLNTFDGILNLLSTCSLSILGNILDFQTYSAPNQDEEDQVSAAQKCLMAMYN